MIDPNTSSTRLTAMETYAQLVEPEYDIPPGGPPPMESPEWQNGVIPLDTLPAAWWNWMWKMVTEQEKRMVRYFNSIMTEFSNLLTAGGVASFDETVTNQLVTAIQTIARTPATTAICGAIKAGTAFGTLAVDGTTGVATVNGAGTGQFNTIATDITGAINELDGDIGQEINDRTSADNTLQGAIDGKAPINHASTTNTYGQADAQNFGHVKLSDDYTDPTLDTAQGIAATPRAVALAVAAAGTTYSSVPIGTIAPYAGPVTVAPRGWIPCDGRAVSRVSYAALYTALGGANSPWGQGDGSTTFNVPDLRESTLVGTDQRTAGVTDHDIYTLGQFKDDQFQDHGHDLTKAEATYYQTHTSGGISTNPAGLVVPSKLAFAPTGTVSTTQNYPPSGPYHWGPEDITTQPSEARWSQYAAKTRYYSEVANSGRTGTTTHGKQTGVNYIIKYEDVQADTSLMEYITNQNKLSAWENITPDTSSDASAEITAQYDGVLFASQTISRNRDPNYSYINEPRQIMRITVNNERRDTRYYYEGTDPRFTTTGAQLTSTVFTIEVPVQKGDVVNFTNYGYASTTSRTYGIITSVTWTTQARYYKDRDYGGV